MRKILPLSLAVLAATLPLARAATLAIGDPAPALELSTWIKGEPLAGLDPDKTYVVECWATWCGPCRRTIPHLTEMAIRYTNVVFVGVAVFERGEDPEDKVAKFVEEMGNKMDYRVAMDTADKSVATHWMEAADQKGIPAAFLVQQGQVVWIGHPMAGLEEALKELAEGTFDIEKARKRAEAKARVEAFFEKAMEGADEASLEEEGRALEALDEEIGGLLPGGQKFNTQEAIQAARFEVAMRAYQKAVFTGRDKEETAKLEAAARAVGPKEMDFDALKARLEQGAGANREMRKVQEVFGKYLVAVGENGDAEKAAGLSKEVEELKITDPAVLNDMAWTILTSENIKQRDFPLAARLAKLAVDASGGENGSILDTYARALFDSGQVAEAIEYQKKAVAAAPNEPDVAETLKRYEAAAAGAKE